MIEGLKALGKTVFLTTHYMDEAQHLADRVAILRAGRIVALGRPDELGAGAETRHGRDVPVASEQLDLEIVRAEVDGGRPRSSATSSRSERPIRRRRSAVSSRWADTHRVTLEHLEVRRPDLEDIFLELMGDGASARMRDSQDRRARQTRYAVVASLRNSRAVVFGIVFPVVLLVLFNSIFSSGKNATDTFHHVRVSTRAYFTAGLAAYAIMLQSFSTLAITMTTQREIGSAEAAAGHADAAVDVHRRAHAARDSSSRSRW